MQQRRVVAIIKKGPAFCERKETAPQPETWQDLVIQDEIAEYKAILKATEAEIELHNYRRFKKQYNQAISLGWL